MNTLRLILLPVFLFQIGISHSAKKDTSQVEWIKVYFNAKSDHDFAFSGNESRDLQDMFLPLLHRIDSANYSIDMVAYDLQNMRVAHALANAARRGVQVRVVTDINNRMREPRFNSPVWDTLRKAGIYSLDDGGTVYHPDGRITELEERLPNSGANMHDKFAIFDYMSSDPEDDYVWTGSMNLTYTGNWNTNATLVIKDNGISEAYFKEFSQMWGSKTAVPNPNKARFHKQKYNMSKNVHFVNDIRVEVYFGPLDTGESKPSISKRITELITDYVRHDVSFLAFAISPQIPISQAMIDRSGRGEIRLRGVIDPAFYSRYRNQGEIWTSPEMNFGNRLILPGKEIRKLHAKTLILDANYPYPEKHKAVTIVGSYNFSKNAEYANDENILIIFDNDIANQFLQDFEGVMSRALKKTQHRAPEIDTNIWYDNYRFGRDGELEIELVTGLFYPVKLLGVDLPRSYAGHKDSCYYFSEESHAYLKQLIPKDSKIKVSAGKEFPHHAFGMYNAYVTVKTASGKIIEINHELLRNGYGLYSKWHRQQQDSILSFNVAVQKAKDERLGMWAQPDSVSMKILTPKKQLINLIFPLDINATNTEELELIPGIGARTAENIMEYVNSREEIYRIDELLNIRGIGTKTIEKLKDYIYVKD